MIPVHKMMGIAYVWGEDIKDHHTAKDWARFQEWITGQTCPMIGVKPAVYLSDYERWLEAGKPAQQGDDWD